MIELEDVYTMNARIKVVGIGGGGCNAINTMIESNLEGVEFIAANTDLQALGISKSPIKVQLGAKLTKGLGAGADPEIVRNAMMEDAEEAGRHVRRWTAFEFTKRCPEERSGTKPTESYHILDVMEVVVVQTFKLKDRKKQ